MLRVFFPILLVFAFLVTFSACAKAEQGLEQYRQSAYCQEIQQRYQCGNSRHNIHLSFDDGVGSVTDDILDVLKKENIKATFFILGNKIDCSGHQQRCAARGSSAACYSEKLCQSRRKTLHRILAEGHDIGSHGYRHDRHSMIIPQLMQRSIQQSRSVLNNFFTTQPAVFRLPYGDGWFNQQQKPHVMQALEQNGFMHIGWEMTAYDWNEKYQQGDKILDNVMTQMCSGKGRNGVVLFHDGVFEKEHEGRLFTAANLHRWIPAMRCVADFQNLGFFRKQLRKIR